MNLDGLRNSTNCTLDLGRDRVITVFEHVEQGMFAECSTMIVKYIEKAMKHYGKSYLDYFRYLSKCHHQSDFDDTSLEGYLSIKASNIALNLLIPYCINFELLEM